MPLYCDFATEETTLKWLTTKFIFSAHDMALRKAFDYVTNLNFV